MLDNIGFWGILIIIACVVIVLLPPKYDPAIKLKEWSERK